MKNIIIIGCDPLTSELTKKFYISEYIENGFQVAYWDCSKYFYPTELVLPNESREGYISKLHSLSEIEKNLAKINIERAIFIIEPSECWENRHFFRLLTQYACFTIKIIVHGNNVDNINFSSSDAFKEKLYRKNLNPITILRKLIEKLAYKAYRKRHKISVYDRLFSSCIFSSNAIKFNHPDYENYIKHSQAESPVASEYIVFLDTFFPEHPDLFLFHSKNQLAYASAYRASLCHFFKTIENKYGLPVLIAAHPKATYSGHEFGNRKIIKYQTAELVIHANKVISQISNSISYALLSDASVVFITNNEYNKYKYLKFSLNMRAKYLGQKVYNIDTLEHKTIPFAPIFQGIRRTYIYNFLTSEETENKSNKDILIDHFKKL